MPHSTALTDEIASELPEFQRLFPIAAYTTERNVQASYTPHIAAGQVKIMNIKCPAQNLIRSF